MRGLRILKIVLFRIFHPTIPRCFTLSNSLINNSKAFDRNPRTKQQPGTLRRKRRRTKSGSQHFVRIAWQPWGSRCAPTASAMGSRRAAATLRATTRTSEHLAAQTWPRRRPSEPRGRRRWLLGITPGVRHFRRTLRRPGWVATVGVGSCGRSRTPRLWPRAGCRRGWWRRRAGGASLSTTRVKGLAALALAAAMPQHRAVREAGRAR